MCVIEAIWLTNVKSPDRYIDVTIEGWFDGFIMATVIIKEITRHDVVTY